jgi:hypothetical protein
MVLFEGDMAFWRMLSIPFAATAVLVGYASIVVDMLEVFNILLIEAIKDNKI